MTLPKTATETGMVDGKVPSADSTGLSMLQKLTLFGVIVGLVLVYLRTRNNKVTTEKSLA